MSGTSPVGLCPHHGVVAPSSPVGLADGVITTHGAQARLMEATSGAEVALVLDHAQDVAAAMRLAAVAGVTGRAASVLDAPRWWRGVSAVVVDDICAGMLAAARLPRRDRVLVVTTGAEVGAATWRDALALGADQVVGLADAAKVADWLARLGEPAAAGRLVCCLSARGGAGSSTLAAALALAGAADRDVLLLDGDMHGGGIDYLLGIESASGARWPELFDASGVIAADALAQALPSVGRVRVLAGRAARPGGLAEPPPAGLAAVVDAAQRGHELVVADGGRGGGIARDLTSYADATVIVLPCEVRATVAAAALAREVESRCSDVRLVVRQGAGGLRPHDVATAVGAPLAAVWPWQRRFDSMVEGGTFHRSWRRTAVAIVATSLLRGLFG